MTKPKAATKDFRNQRVYPVTIPDSDPPELMELPSVSALQGNIYKFALERWKRETVAEQFAKRPDLVMLASTDVRDATQQALNAVNRQANVGTAVHALSEKYEEGTLEMNKISATAKPWVESYIRAKERYEWTVVLMEETVYNFEYGYAGTADRVLDIPNVGRCVVDLKSGEAYADSSAQISLYAFAEGVWVPPDACPGAAGARTRLEKDISAGTNLDAWLPPPPKRRGWSKAAQDAARELVKAQYWAEYARLGQRLPMPEGLDKEIGFLLKLYENGQPGDLIPLKLDPELPRALGCIFRWSNDRSIMGDVLVSPKDPPVPEPAEEAYIAESHSDGELATSEVSEADLKSGVLQAVGLLRNRAKALPADKQKRLKEAWPDGVAPLTRPDDHTIETVVEISKLITEYETLEEVGAVFAGSVEI